MCIRLLISIVRSVIRSSRRGVVCGVVLWFGVVARCGDEGLFAIADFEDEDLKMHQQHSVPVPYGPRGSMLYTTLLDRRMLF
jgi:hypothetical protein